MTLKFTPAVKYLITKGDATPENFLEKKNEIVEIVKRSTRRGVGLIQIREKKLTAKLVFELTKAAVEAAAESAAAILVNDRFDIAIAANAHGVHLTASSLSASIVRSYVPKDFIIGASTHTLEEVTRARDNGADFALFGPVFPTPGKGEPAGVEKLWEICRAVSPYPILAVGGIDENNYGSVIDAGASGFAAIRYLNEFVNITE